MNKWVKRILLAFAAMVLLLFLVNAMGILLDGINAGPPVDEAGQIARSVKELHERLPGWQKIAQMPLFADMGKLMMVDGSRQTVPLTAELLRQFYDVTDESLDRRAAQEGGTQEWWRIIAHSGTQEAYRCLAKGYSRSSAADGDSKWGQESVQILFVTAPAAELLAEADPEQYLNFAPEMTPIAKDALVFITHKDNPVESLSAAQIRQIYNGEISNWQAVGGADAAIAPQSRPEYTDSARDMNRIVMQGKPLYTGGLGGCPDSMAELIYQVESDREGSFGIGYTYAYYVSHLHKSANIKILNVNGVSPENENLRSGKYPFAIDYCAVIRKSEPKSSDARMLLDYLLSEEGQKIVEMAGYCPVK